MVYFGLFIDDFKGDIDLKLWSSHGCHMLLATRRSRDMSTIFKMTAASVVWIKWSRVRVTINVCTCGLTFAYSRDDDQQYSCYQRWIFLYKLGSGSTRREALCHGWSPRYKTGILHFDQRHSYLLYNSWTLMSGITIAMHQAFTILLTLLPHYQNNAKDYSSI